MKDLSHLCYFLGLEAAYAHQGYLISLRKYTCNLINHACLTDSHIAVTLMELHQQLSTSDGEPLTYLTR